MKRYLILLIIVLTTGGAFLWQIYLPRDFNSEKEVIFQVEGGWGSKEIALNLEKEGLIWWGPVFRIYVLSSGKAGQLQAGFYSLSPSMNLSTIAHKLATGDIAKAEITIPEGFTVKQIQGKLKNVTSSEDVTWGEFEGYLFPDTYEILYGAEAEEIIEMMRDNFNKKTAGLKISPEDIIMASLLEKEVKTFEDKQLVSGVLWKRLRAGIPLQVDATISYITGERTIKISKKDTQIDSPFNTYRYYGLPAGPICNPGLESIKAAVYPKDSEFWYYLSTPEGETIFSRTLEEHNIAKARYLK